MKSEVVYVEHVLDCIDRIDQYTKGGKSHFISSRLVQDAVVRNLQVLAESTQRLSDPIKRRYPEVDWRGLSGFRNVLAHGYLGLDIERVWDLIEVKLPMLRTNMQQILSDLNASGV